MNGVFKCPGDSIDSTDRKVLCFVFSRPGKSATVCRQTSGPRGRWATGLRSWQIASLSLGPPCGAAQSRRDGPISARGGAAASRASDAQPRVNRSITKRSPKGWPYDRHAPQIILRRHQPRKATRASMNREVRETHERRCAAARPCGRLIRAIPSGFRLPRYSQPRVASRSFLASTPPRADIGTSLRDWLRLETAHFGRTGFSPSKPARTSCPSYRNTKMTRGE